jgi:hypothetical protein
MSWRPTRWSYSPTYSASPSLGSETIAAGSTSVYEVQALADAKGKG